MHMREVSLKPVLKAEQFFKEANRQLAYVTLSKAQIDMKGFNFDAEELSMDCNSITINHPNVDVLKNKAYSWDEKREELMFNEIIKSSPIPLKVDSLLVKNGNISSKYARLQAQRIHACAYTA